MTDTAHDKPLAELLRAWEAEPPPDRVSADALFAVARSRLPAAGPLPVRRHQAGAGLAAAPRALHLGWVGGPALCR
jgi:hypothetical protein